MPFLSASVPLTSVTSLMPSLSESRSRLSGMVSPSVSTGAAAFLRIGNAVIIVIQVVAVGDAVTIGVIDTQREESTIIQVDIVEGHHITSQRAADNLVGIAKIGVAGVNQQDRDLGRQRRSSPAQ